jgi:hypothetical protein
MMKQYSLCKFVAPKSELRHLYPFNDSDVFVFMGEIPNMMDHCVVANVVTGRVISGFHIEDFVELTEDEV